METQIPKIHTYNILLPSFSTKKTTPHTLTHPPGPLTDTLAVPFLSPFQQTLPPDIIICDEFL
jgi:hypothetical protein